jgi:hypothetical protein
MTKYELLKCLAQLTLAAHELPDTACVFKAESQRDDHGGRPTIMVDELHDMPTWGVTTISPLDEAWTNHARLVGGVEVYCLIARREGA